MIEREALISAPVPSVLQNRMQSVALAPCEP
jgi:hypothetical protein